MEASIECRQCALPSHWTIFNSLSLPPRKHVQIQMIESDISMGINLNVIALMVTKKSLFFFFNDSLTFIVNANDLGLYSGYLQIHRTQVNS